MILFSIEIVIILMLFFIILAMFWHERLMAKKSVPQAVIDGYLRGADRRKYTRFKRSLDAIYKIERRPHIRMMCRTIDISQGGLRLLVDAKFEQGEVIHLVIALPDSENLKIEAEGKVVWSEPARDFSDPSGKRYFYAGIQFCGITSHDAQLLTTFIKTLSEEDEI